MRNGFFILVALATAGCASSARDVSVNSNLGVAIQTRINFLPPTRQEALRNLEVERAVHGKHTAPIKERIGELERGRDQRYHEIYLQFPECKRQRHCQSQLSRGSVKKFERYGELAKEINEYDSRIAELEGALHEWDWRYEVRQRAILNRYLVHEFLNLPKVDSRFQGVLVHSLETFGTRKEMSMRLLRFAGEGVVPTVLGDLDFRHLGRPVDEAAVLATFDVYLAGRPLDPAVPTRYVVTMLVDTHQLDLHYYESDFLRVWADRLTEPFQKKLRETIYCSVYAIAGKTLVPKLSAAKVKPCTLVRTDTQAVSADNFKDRFGPDYWMVPVAYYPMTFAGGSN